MVAKEEGIPRKRPICTNCGLTGHITDKCYKLHGYPPGCKPKGENKAIANQVTSNFGNFDAPIALTNSQVNGTLPSSGFNQMSHLQHQMFLVVLLELFLYSQFNSLLWPNV